VLPGPVTLGLGFLRPAVSKTKQLFNIFDDFSISTFSQKNQYNQMILLFTRRTKNVIILASEGILYVIFPEIWGRCIQ
jgi:hypothetical protein